MNNDFFAFAPPIINTQPIQKSPALFVNKFILEYIKENQTHESQSNFQEKTIPIKKKSFSRQSTNDSDDQAQIEYNFFNSSTLVVPVEKVNKFQLFQNCQQTDQKKEQSQEHNLKPMRYEFGLELIDLLESEYQNNTFKLSNYFVQMNFEKLVENFSEKKGQYKKALSEIILKDFSEVIKRYNSGKRMSKIGRKFKNKRKLLKQTNFTRDVFTQILRHISGFGKKQNTQEKVSMFLEKYGDDEKTRIYSQQYFSSNNFSCVKAVKMLEIESFKKDFIEEFLRRFSMIQQKFSQQLFETEQEVRWFYLDYVNFLNCKSYFRLFQLNFQ